MPRVKPGHLSWVRSSARKSGNRKHLAGSSTQIDLAGNLRSTQPASISRLLRCAHPSTPTRPRIQHRPNKGVGIRRLSSSLQHASQEHSRKRNAAPLKGPFARKAPSSAPLLAKALIATAGQGKPNFERSAIAYAARQDSGRPKPKGWHGKNDDGYQPRCWINLNGQESAAR